MCVVAHSQRLANPVRVRCSFTRHPCARGVWRGRERACRMSLALPIEIPVSGDRFPLCRSARRVWRANTVTACSFRRGFPFCLRANCKRLACAIRCTGRRCRLELSRVAARRQLRALTIRVRGRSNRLELRGEARAVVLALPVMMCVCCLCLKLIVSARGVLRTDARIRCCLWRHLPLCCSADHTVLALAIR